MSAVQLELLETIAHVDPAEWDAVVGHKPFSTHRFLECLERSQLPDVQIWHVLLRKHGRPVGCTSLYSHPFRIADLYVPVREAPAIVRRMVSHAVDTHAVVCGLPISLGKRHVYFCDALSADERREAWSSILHAMEDVSGPGVGVLGVKEFSPCDEQDAALGELLHRSLVRCDAPPTVDLSLRWRSFDDYVAAMRSGYRRQLKADADLLAASPVTWRFCAVDEIDTATLHRLYLNVMENSAERFEYLSQGFLSALARYFPSEAELIVGELGSDVVVYGILRHASSTTTFMFCGMDYRYVREHATYRILLQHIVRRAIERGSVLLELGQSSYDAKERLGGTPSPRFYFIKPRNPIVRAALKALGPYLDAAEARAPRNVFRSAH